MDCTTKCAGVPVAEGVAQQVHKNISIDEKVRDFDHIVLFILHFEQSQSFSCQRHCSTVLCKTVIAPVLVSVGSVVSGFWRIFRFSPCFAEYTVEKCQTYILHVYHNITCSCPETATISSPTASTEKFTAGYEDVSKSSSKQLRQ